MNSVSKVKMIDKSIWIGMLILVILMPLLFSPSSYSQFKLPKIVAASWIILFFYILWTYRSFVLNDLEIKLGFLIYLIIIYIIFNILAVVFSLHMHTALWGRYNWFEGFFSVLLYMAVFLTAVNFKWSKLQLDILLKSIVIVAGIISFYALVQAAGYDFIDWHMQNFGAGRSFANFGNPVYLGDYLSLIFPLSIVLFIKEKQRIRQIIWLFFIFIVLSGLLVTMTRGAWLSVFIVFIIMLIAGIYKRLAVWRYLIIVAVFITAFFLGVFLLSISSSNNNLSLRLGSATNFNKETIDSRIEIWKGAIEITRARPYFGYGPDSFGLVYSRYKTLEAAKFDTNRRHTDNAHNWFLEMASTTGIPATIIFITLFSLLIYHSLRNNQLDSNISVTIFGIGMALLSYVLALFSAISVFGSSVLFWLLAGTAASFLSPKIILKDRSILFIARVLLLTITLLLLILVSVLTKKYLADTWYLAGNKYIGSGYAVESLSAFNQAITLDPGESYYYHGLGEAYIKIGQKSADITDFQEAVDKLSTAKHLNPYNIQVYLSLAQAYSLAANFGDNNNLFKALDTLKSAKRLAPKSSELLFRLGVVELKLGNLKAAENNLKQSIKISPNDSSTYVVIGSLYERKNLIKKARKSYLKAIKINPGDMSAMDARIRLKRLNE